MDSACSAPASFFSNARPSMPLMSMSAGIDYDEIDESALPYVYRAHLGKGGYGLVEEVEDCMTGRVFARKIFHSSKRERVRMTEMFEEEARNMRALAKHHHMVQLYATYRTKDTFAMIMTPVADSGDLAKFMDDFASYRNALAGRASACEEMRMHGMISVLKMSFGCLAAGLTFMHDQRIRHKDIKPGNILIHRGRVLYTDFGIARDTTLLPDSATTGPAIKATRKYAAPEVLSNELRRSSSDVYSLGCVFVEIFAALTGLSKIPEAQRYSERMDSIRKELSMPYSGPADLSLLPVLVLGMTERDPSVRYTALQVWRMCDDNGSLRCARCHSFHARPAQRKTHYSPWTYSETHQKYFSHKFSAGNKILNTLWTHHRHLQQGRAAAHDYLESHVDVYGSANPLDEQPGGRWSPWTWSDLHCQYYSKFVQASGRVIAVLWNSRKQGESGAPLFKAPIEAAEDPPSSVHYENFCICKGFVSSADEM